MTIFYHNPKCRTSRTALALLKEHAIPITVRDYITDGFSYTELQSVLSQLACPIKEYIRPKEASEYGLDITCIKTDWVDAILTYPRLLQRPILVHKDNAYICRPAEKVLDSFHDSL